jgi:hypothetical protein
MKAELNNPSSFNAIYAGSFSFIAVNPIDSYVTGNDRNKQEQSRQTCKTVNIELLSQKLKCLPLNILCKRFASQASDSSLKADSKKKLTFFKNHTCKEGQINIL